MESVAEADITATRARVTTVALRVLFLLLEERIDECIREKPP
jgi:hypothetical protein